jgi:hypothetical protein
MTENEDSFTDTVWGITFALAMLAFVGVTFAFANWGFGSPWIFGVGAVVLILILGRLFLFMRRLESR